MAVLNPDTSLAEDFSKPIEPGTYPARIVQVDAGKSKKGNDKIMPKFKIKTPDGERTRVSHIVISGEGAMGFDGLLRAAKMTDLAEAYRDKALKTKPAFDTNSLVGIELQVVIEPNLYHNDDTGKDENRDQIAGFLPL
jgi:hypothetical protein